MSVLDEIRIRGHEHVGFFQDPESGAQAIIAIHSTVLGPSLGGCRMNLYPSLDAALLDVLRLSEGMTYKNSLAGLGLGGGKAVLVADRTVTKGRDTLFRAFGRFVQSLGGRYLTAEDMGTSVADMNIVLEETAFVTGRDPSVGGGGDPSPYTALGVFCGMRACLERVFGSGNFRDRRIAIQGVGHVGHFLAKHLAEAGAKLIVADARMEVAQAAGKDFGAEVVSPESILQVECDILSPNAVGAIINPESVGTLRCKIVAGGANNQISGQRTEEELHKRGIVYAPDFAINAGGVILCADELEPGGFTAKRVRERVEKIYGTVGRILDEAKSSGRPSGAIAIQHARERIQQASRSRHQG